LEGVDFSKQVNLIERATSVVQEMVAGLRKSPSLEATKLLNDRMQGIESEADRVVIIQLKELYCGHFQPLKALLVKDLYDLLEKVIDRCRDAANAVTHIVMKNS
jgi:hypothetical protein